MKKAQRLPRGLTLAAAAAMAALALGVLGTLVWRDRELLLSYDWQVRWQPLVVALGIYMVALLLAAAVWADIMAAMGSRLGMATHIRYYAITHLSKRLPGTLWYVAGRGYLYSRHGDSVGLVTVASGLELAAAVLGGIVVSLGFLAGSTWDVVRAQAWVLVLLLLGGLALLHPRVVRWLLARFKLEIPTDLAASRLLRWVGGHALVWVMGGVIVQLAIQGLLPSLAAHWAYVIGAWSLVGVLSVSVFFLPSNLGFTEVGLSLLLARILPSSFAVFVAVFVRLLLLAFEIGTISLYLLAAHLRMRAAKEPSVPPSTAP